MKDVFSILKEISEENSNNKKMDILKKYLDNKTLERVMYLALSKRVKFFIKQVPPYQHKSSSMSLETALDDLSVLTNREKTGNEGIEHLKSILESLDPNNAYIIERIIDKNLKIGMGTSNINKCFKNLIEKTPYMGAK